MQIREFSFLKDIMLQDILRADCALPPPRPPRNFFLAAPLIGVIDLLTKI